MDIILSRNGTILDDEHLQSITNTILKPLLHKDALPVIKELQAFGYIVLCSSPLETSMYSRCIQPFLPLEHPPHITLPQTPLTDATKNTLFGGILEHIGSIHPGIALYQILMITTGLYPVVEEANSERIPTVLVTRDIPCMENKLVIPSAVPTFVTNDLTSLCSKLKGGTTFAPPENTDVMQNDQNRNPLPYFRPFRVCRYYQGDQILGEGGFGTCSECHTFNFSSSEPS